MASTSGISSGILNQLAESELNPLDDDKYARFVIHSNHRVFSRAINALSKLGVDLYIEASELGLAIKSFNKTKSAYGLFLFSSEFFSEVDASIFTEDSNNRLFRISMKCALSLFKGLQFNEKTFVSCEFRINPASDVFIVQLLYAYDVCKTLEINLLETHTSFRTTIDKSTLQNLTVIVPSLLHSILQSLGNTEEMIIQASPNEFILKNYFANEDDNRKIVKTQAKLSTSNLERHNSPISTEIAMSLKEFMSILTFADQNNALLSLYYDVPGKPLVVALEGDIVYSAEFIIATVEAENFEADEHRELSTQQISRNNSQNSTRNNTRRSRSTAPGPSQPRITSMFHPNTVDVATPRLNSTRAEPPVKSSRIEEEEPPLAELVPEDIPQNEQSNYNYDPRPDINGSFMEPFGASSSSLIDNHTAVSQVLTDVYNNMKSKTKYTDAETFAIQSDRVVTPADLKKDDELPETPPPSDQHHILLDKKEPEIKKPNKKPSNTFRRFFLGEGTATQHQSQIGLNATVLAEDTDEEWD